MGQIAEVVISPIGPKSYGLQAPRLPRRAEEPGRDRQRQAASGPCRRGHPLEVDGKRLVDSPYFPEVYQPEGLTISKTLDFLKDLDDEFD
ncbi:hypothetical protein [Kribbella sp. CA-294648]|uniref:hypothetical protein n=1 Tax=Kribbella sp. CA-294648 TaxID=3239948 RepID=UPI003D931A13